MSMCVCNNECMCIVRLINIILVLMYVDVRLVTDYNYFKLGFHSVQKCSTTLMQK